MLCSSPLSGRNSALGQWTPSQWLAQEAQKAEESQPLKDMVLAQYCDFRDVFSKEAFDKLPPWKAWDHAIDLGPSSLTPGHSPCPLQNRRSSTTSSMRTLQMATSIHPSLPWGLLCSSLRRRTDHSALHRTIGN